MRVQELLDHNGVHSVLQVLLKNLILKFVYIYIDVHR